MRYTAILPKHGQFCQLCVATYRCQNVFVVDTAVSSSVCGPAWFCRGALQGFSWAVTKTTLVCFKSSSFYGTGVWEVKNSNVGSPPPVSLSTRTYCWNSRQHSIAVLYHTTQTTRRNATPTPGTKTYNSSNLGLVAVVSRKFARPIDSPRQRASSPFPSSTLAEPGSHTEKDSSSPSADPPPHLPSAVHGFNIYRVYLSIIFRYFDGVGHLKKKGKNNNEIQSDGGF